MSETPVKDAIEDYPTEAVDLAKIAPAFSHWDMIDELREKYRFFRNNVAQGYWVFTRYEDIREAFHQPEVFSNHSINASDPDPAYRFLPSFLDPPEHTKYRQTMNRWFAPDAVARHSPRLRELVRERVEAVAPLGRCDYMADIGDAFSVAAFLTTSGLPLDDADFFVSCVRRMKGASHSPETMDRMMAAWNDIRNYWIDLLAQRKARPADPEVDFVTHLMRSQVNGKPLPDEDIIDMMTTLTLGSLENVKGELGWGTYYLATHDDDRRRIVENPALIPGAIEEFLRVFPMVSMARKVTRDVNFHGCPMKKDDMVLLSIQSATRDPRQFPDADKVIIDRQPNRHIAFGASPHRCLGSHLAREEMKVALEEWHRLIPDYHLDTDETLMAQGGLVSLFTLPLAW